MIQDIITFIIVAVAVLIAGVYVFKMFCSKKHGGCAGCTASGCALKDKMNENEKGVKSE